MWAIPEEELNKAAKDLNYSKPCSKGFSTIEF